jgi:dienelactone hydrolase
LIAVLGLAPPQLWAAPDRVAVPAPSGPYRVGSLSLQLVDATRDDPFAKNGSKRELLVRFWYPTVVAQGCKPAEYSSTQVQAYLSQLAGAPALEVTTNSCWQSQVALGAHPVIVATHGYTGMLTDYTFLFEDLASRGYVVASVAHTYETTAVEFSDGRLITSVFGSHLVEDSLRTDLRSLARARSVRLQDLRFVVAELERLNSTPGGPLFHRLDLARMGIMGHSLGGEAALSSLEELPGLKAAVLLDAVVSPASAQGTNKPVLMVGEGRTSWEPEECRLWRNLRGPHLALNFAGAEHNAPTDALWLGVSLPAVRVETGSLGPQQTTTALRRYLAAFFDTYLLGRSPSPLLMGNSLDYAGVRVTTSQQPLCGQR